VRPMEKRIRARTKSVGGLFSDGIDLRTRHNMESAVKPHDRLPVQHPEGRTMQVHESMLHTLLVCRPVGTSNAAG
jgi:hypothetical protein